MFYLFTSLISSIIQNDVNGLVRILLPEQFKSFTDTVRIKIFFVHHLLCLQCDSIQKAKEIHTLSSVGRWNMQTFFTPGISSCISINQVDSITEKYLRKSICCHIQQWKQDIVQEIQLCFQICFSWYTF